MNNIEKEFEELIKTIKRHRSVLKKEWGPYYNAGIAPWKKVVQRYAERQKIYPISAAQVLSQSDQYSGSQSSKLALFVAAIEIMKLE